ncbi:MAG: hypothetical protein LAO03_02850 [Acidobacteriia bacterium]|nr:hypothetical protein [Terriglobia bacterium]
MTHNMRMTLAILFLAILASTAVGQNTKPVSPSKAPSAAPAAQAGPTVDADQQAMKQDVQKMRVVLNQMRTNLAFVGSSTTPLNHQFELDIEMWQMLLDQMERRIDAVGRQATEKH